MERTVSDGCSRGRLSCCLDLQQTHLKARQLSVSQELRSSLGKKISIDNRIKSQTVNELKVIRFQCSCLFWCYFSSSIQSIVKIPNKKFYFSFQIKFCGCKVFSSCLTKPSPQTQYTHASEFILNSRIPLCFTSCDSVHMQCGWQ